MPVVLIRCHARKCDRNRLSGFRFRGYEKCFGCPAAMARNEQGSWRMYNKNNFNLEELREKAKKSWRRQMK